ncbi:MAG: zinc-dependent alcohol dehydrogenase [Christensenellales bacterium]
MDTTMKAVILNAPGSFEVGRVPVPRARRGEALVRIHSVSICGSDPKVIDRKLGGNWPPCYPFVIGHEFAGEVVATGEDVHKFKIGDRVAGEAHCGCGFCANCMQGRYNICLNYGRSDSGHRHYGFTYQGAYAEYNAYNIRALTKMPDGVSYDEGTMCDTAGTSLNGIRLIGLTPGGFCVIVGPGPIGLCAMMLAKSMGSRTIVVGRGDRLAAAKRLGSDFIIHYEQEDVSARILEITDGLGAHEALECAGNEQAANMAILSLRRGGKVSLLGMPNAADMVLPIKKIVHDEIIVAGVRANPNCSDLVLGMMANGALNVKGMITHSFALEDFAQALDTFLCRKDGALKVVLHP